MDSDNMDTSGPTMDSRANGAVKREYDHLFYRMDEGPISSVDSKPAINGNNELIDWLNIIAQEKAGRYVKVEIHVYMQDKNV